MAHYSKGPVPLPRNSIPGSPTHCSSNLTSLLYFSSLSRLQHCLLQNLWTHKWELECGHWNSVYLRQERLAVFILRIVIGQHHILVLDRTVQVEIDRVISLLPFWSVSTWFSCKCSTRSGCCTRSWWWRRARWLSWFSGQSWRSLCPSSGSLRRWSWRTAAGRRTWSQSWSLLRGLSCWSCFVRRQKRDCADPQGAWGWSRGNRRGWWGGRRRRTWPPSQRSTSSVRTALQIGIHT